MFSNIAEAVSVFPWLSASIPRAKVRIAVPSFSFSSLSFLLHGVYTLRPEGLGGFYSTAQGQDDLERRVFRLRPITRLQPADGLSPWYAIRCWITANASISMRLLAHEGIVFIWIEDANRSAQEGVVKVPVRSWPLSKLFHKDTATTNITVFAAKTPPFFMASSPSNGTVCNRPRWFTSPKCKDRTPTASRPHSGPISGSSWTRSEQQYISDLQNL